MEVPGIGGPPVSGWKRSPPNGMAKTGRPPVKGITRCGPGSSVFGGNAGESGIVEGAADGIAGATWGLPTGACGWSGPLAASFISCPTLAMIL